MTATPARMTVTALSGLPEVRPGADLAAMIADAAADNGETLQDGDVVVVAQKIVSKAENRFADLATVRPSARARELADAVDKDPRLVELILSESSEVLRHRPGVLIVVHRCGYVLANAGIDASNVGAGSESETVLLLPVDADASARALAGALGKRSGARVAVIVNDSLGRAWRNGTVGIALGAAGLPALLDQRGRADRDGRTLRVSETGFADELAAAASAMMGQADESRPVVLIRGAPFPPADGSAHDLIRPREIDLFR